MMRFECQWASGRLAMHVEPEVIDQICHDEGGWAMARVVALIHALGRPDHLVVLQGMWRSGRIAFHTSTGANCAEWDVRAFFRSGQESTDWYVVATAGGLAAIDGD